MRILLIVVIFLAAAAVVDNLWFNGRNSHALWQEVKYQGDQIKYQVDSIVGKVIGR